MPRVVLETSEELNRFRSQRCSSGASHHGTLLKIYPPNKKHRAFLQAQNDPKSFAIGASYTLYPPMAALEEGSHFAAGERIGAAPCL